MPKDSDVVAWKELDTDYEIECLSLEDLTFTLRQGSVKIKFGPISSGLIAGFILRKGSERREQELLMSVKPMKGPQ